MIPSDRIQFRVKNPSQSRLRAVRNVSNFPGFVASFDARIRALGDRTSPNVVGQEQLRPNGPLRTPRAPSSAGSTRQWRVEAFLLRFRAILFPPSGRRRPFFAHLSNRPVSRSNFGRLPEDPQMPKQI